VEPPPYRIETERLVVRCWERADAALLKEALDASLDHLRPWMPWAWDEPQTLDEKEELLGGFHARFAAGEDFIYALFSRDESRVLGGSGLHRRVGPDAFEIGYWVRADDVGHGLCTEATAALTRVGFDVAHAERMEIHVDPANEASLRVPRKLGFLEEATLRRRLPGRPGDPKQDCVVFSLLAEELPGSPVAALSGDIAAFDAAGLQLL
jgi:RimJ/RimL family protein N-acetyltransferase